MIFNNIIEISNYVITIKYGNWTIKHIYHVEGNMLKIISKIEFKNM